MVALDSADSYPKASRALRIAVIGAGMSGLACAQALADAGLMVRVFDKGRGAGGRMSTRRAEPWHFDHGTQYLTVRDPEFGEQVARWESAGLMQAWRGSLVELRKGAVRSIDDGQLRYVGVPRMNAILNSAARYLEVRCGALVSSLVQEDEGWRLIEFSGIDLGVFQVVVVAAPAPQSVKLLSAAPMLAKRAASIDMAPCWSVMLAFNNALELDFDGAFIKDSPLAWAARDNSKPGRPSAEAWVLQATSEWSARYLEGAGEQISAMLLAAFAESLGNDKLVPVMRLAHRWRYASPVSALGESCLYDPVQRLGACGDWCLEGRVEAAWRSGRALAARILANA